MELFSECVAPFIALIVAVFVAVVCNNTSTDCRDSEHAWNILSPCVYIFEIRKNA